MHRRLEPLASKYCLGVASWPNSKKTQLLSGVDRYGVSQRFQRQMLVCLLAALLADRARAARDMPTVRHMVAGTEFVLKVGPEDSLHDFYVKAKEALGLDPKGHISLALLRTGDNTKTREQRTLHCSRFPGTAMPHVKGKVFEAYCHR